MYSELKKIISDIKTNTDVDVILLSKDGNVIYATELFLSAVPLINQEVLRDNEIVFDIEKNITYSLIDALIEPVICVISGSDKNSVNFLHLLNTIICNLQTSINEIITKDESLNLLLSGKLTYIEAKQIKLKYNMLDSDYYIFVINVDKKNTDEVVEFLNTFSSSEHDICIEMENEVICYIKYMDFIDDKTSAFEFATLLVDTIFNELLIKVQICIGKTVQDVLEFSNSYLDAYNGLKTALKYFKYSKSIFSVNEFALPNLLKELPNEKITELKKLLLSPSTIEIMRDSDLVTTAEVFLNNSLNISLAARSLYIHRNTLMYRLDKIEKDTGLNIKVFADAVTFRLIGILYRIADVF